VSVAPQSGASGAHLGLAADLTVCICTRDRPEDLGRAIESVVRAAPQAHMLVSDDGGGTARAVAERFPRCRWQAGPARGLGANRNAAVRSVKTGRVLFLDDDAELGEGFLPAVEHCLAGLGAEAAARTIVTGRELNRGVLVAPNDVDFLGFQRRRYEQGGRLRTVVINAAVWPRPLFEEIGFDERLRYGSDEVDLSYSALAAGYRIESCPEAVNEHRPSPHGRAEYALDAHASRLRATTKRYWRLQRRRTTALAYTAIAPVHLLLAMLKREGMRGLWSFAAVMRRWLAPPTSAGAGAETES